MQLLKPAILAFVASLGLVSLAHADEASDCARAAEAEARMRACSAVIAGPGFGPEQKATAYRNRGRTRVEAGALDAAISDLDQALRLNPADYQGFTYRALARTGRDDIDGAIADYSEVVRLRPNSAIGYNGRGHAHLVKRMAPQAISDFSAAVRLNPTSATALNNRGLAHKLAGDLPRAIEDYTRAIMLNPIYALAFNNRGYAYEAAGRKAEAIADYRNALLVDPSLVGAKDGLARLGTAAPAVAESEKLILEGRALVETHCASCHAIGSTGNSPRPGAPEFRTLHTRHPLQGLREPLTRGIAAPHDEMPKFKLPNADIDRVVAYINSLGRRP